RTRRSRATPFSGFVEFLPPASKAAWIPAAFPVSSPGSPQLKRSAEYSMRNVIPILVSAIVMLIPLALIGLAVGWIWAHALDGQMSTFLKWGAIGGIGYGFLHGWLMAFMTKGMTDEEVEPQRGGMACMGMVIPGLAVLTGIGVIVFKWLF
ncbi:hypothetical protein ACFQY0_21285, partial [Haloferula chungangensis]